MPVLLSADAPVTMVLRRGFEFLLGLEPANWATATDERRSTTIEAW